MQPTAGLGFKPEHFEDARTHRSMGLWYEVHAENYMVDGGPRLAMLEALRGECSISVHGVGLSLAADADPDPEHLERLCAVVRRVEPFLVSEHLAWSSFAGQSFPDLLPFPRSREALRRISRNIEITQNALGRKILIENPSLYAPLEGHELTETEFLTELVSRTGCGLLVDVNNAYVSGSNLGHDPEQYLTALPANAVGEIHLAGHSVEGSLLIDTHGAPVAEAVWGLYQTFIQRIGPRPTLIERDDNLPAFHDLMAERDRAHGVLAGGLGACRTCDAPAAAAPHRQLPAILSLT